MAVSTRMAIKVSGDLLAGNGAKRSYAEIRELMEDMGKRGAGYARELAPVSTGTFRDSIHDDPGDGLTVIYGHSDDRITERNFLTWLERGTRGGSRAGKRTGNRMFAKSAKRLRDELPGELDHLADRLVRELGG